MGRSSLLPSVPAKIVQPRLRASLVRHGDLAAAAVPVVNAGYVSRCVSLPQFHAIGVRHAASDPCHVGVPTASQRALHRLPAFPSAPTLVLQCCTAVRAIDGRAARTTYPDRAHPTRRELPHVREIREAVSRNVSLGSRELVEPGAVLADK